MYHIIIEFMEFNLCKYQFHYEYFRKIILTKHAYQYYIINVWCSYVFWNKIGKIRMLPYFKYNCAYKIWYRNIQCSNNQFYWLLQNMNIWLIGFLHYFLKTKILSLHLLRAYTFYLFKIHFVNSILFLIQPNGETCKIILIIMILAVISTPSIK